MSARELRVCVTASDYEEALRFDRDVLGLREREAFVSEDGHVTILEAGAATLELLDPEERELRAWDFLHCAPGTRHTFVGTGDAPCVIFMTGARREDGTIVYPHSDTADAHDAGVATETPSPAEAYARFPAWRPGRPDTWATLPWA